MSFLIFGNRFTLLILAILLCLSLESSQLLLMFLVTLEQYLGIILELLREPCDAVLLVIY